MKRDIFIGGAWPYANNSLHIGHLAALLPADIIARYFRGNGDNVIYVSGTDSHGTPITVRAKKENINPKDIATQYHKEFVSNFNDLDFSYDLYSSTMEDFHKIRVQKYFTQILNNGYIYEKEEDQDFCEICDNFLSDREIIGVCPHCGGAAKGDQCDKCLTTLVPKEILDKHCMVCGSSVVVRKNKHLYFELSKFQDMLRELVNNKDNNWRRNAVSEATKYLNMGLIDRAATRQLTWGIDVPVEGYEDKKIYVWIEAVLGYLTAGEQVALTRGINFEEYMMKRSDLNTYLVHGKDNIPFHTIIYPALLNAINKDMQLPQNIISSEYVNMNNEKMSKSTGNLISVNELISKFNKDTIRYYIISNGPEKKDINFSQEDLIQNHNKFLVGVFGNFINRNLSFITKKFNGVITCGNVDEEIQNKTKEVVNTVGKLIEKGELKSAINMVMDYAVLGNKYYDEQKPWIQVKENMESFNNTTYTCVYMMANLANLFAPFMPSTTDKIRKMLNLPGFKWGVTQISGDIQIKESNILFDRIENIK